MGFFTRLKHGWNAFRSRDPTKIDTMDFGPGYGRRPDTVRLRITNERSILASVINRIAIDVASIDFKHVRIDQNGRFVDEIDSDLNKALNVSPNLDQTPRGFKQDAVISMFDEGNIAIFPSEADLDPVDTGSYKIYELRIGKIVEWYPTDVMIEAYNPELGHDTRLVMPKSIVAIIENPLYTTMNGPNSTLQRLINKLNILDAIDRQSGSGKLDLIIQLPYKLHTPGKQELAEDRRKKIEMQLTDSKYGIAYIDATEKIIQLNRPIENNLLTQVEYLTKEFYSQLGMTPGVMDGTASDQEQVTYSTRIVEPIADTFVSEFRRKFLTKTARSQGQTIMYFQNPFKLMPPSQIPDMADKLIRNTVLSSNEFRAILGYRPSEEKKADELYNPNIAAAKQDSASLEGPADAGGMSIDEEE